MWKCENVEAASSQRPIEKVWNQQIGEVNEERT